MEDLSVDVALSSFSSREELSCNTQQFLMKLQFLMQLDSLNAAIRQIGLLLVTVSLQPVVSSALFLL